MAAHFLDRLRARYRSTREATRLASDWASWLKLAVAANWLPLESRLRLPPWYRPTVLIRAGDGDCRFQLAEQSHLWALRQVLLHREYDWELPGRVRTILDLGANVGSATVFFKQRFPDATIHAVEPDPFAYELLARNVAQWDDVFAHRLAVSDETGRAAFFAAPHQSWSSSLQRRAPGDVGVEVETRRLDDLMVELGLAQVDLIKFDLEGAEYRVFEDAQSALRARILIGEVHLDLIDATEAEFFELFQGFAVTTRRLSSSRLLARIVQSESAAASGAME